MKKDCFKSCFYSKAGFTLIELLVVVLIIGILAAVAVPQYQKAVDKARVSELLAIVKNIKVQQEVFYLTNGHYAANCEELGADLPAGFAKSSPNSDGYELQKGNYKLVLKCKNNVNPRAMGAVSAGTLFSVTVEAFFDHIPQAVWNSYPEDEGRIFCYAGNGDRALNVCKSLGKEKRDDSSYWL